MSRWDDFGMVGYPESRVGITHSDTLEESLTWNFLEKQATRLRFAGKFIDRTKPDWYYCIVENGVVFKFHPDELLFYALDLEQLVWRRNQALASLYLNPYLRFQEFRRFVDCYPHAEETE